MSLREAHCCRLVEWLWTNHGTDPPFYLCMAEMEEIYQEGIEAEDPKMKQRPYWSNSIFHVYIKPAAKKIG